VMCEPGLTSDTVNEHDASTGYLLPRAEATLRNELQRLAKQ
jgi:hypothetical protein